MFGLDRSFAIWKTYSDGRRPVCIKRHVTEDYAKWWCSTREGYTWGRY